MTTLGIVALLNNNLITERKKAFLRNLAWDVETQATLFFNHRERRLAEMTDEKGKLLKKDMKEREMKEEKERKIQVQKQRALAKGNNVSPKEREAAILKAQKERQLLEKTKGKGYKKIDPRLRELERIRQEKVALQKERNRILANQRAEEEKKRKEEQARLDRERSEQHKQKLLEEKMWADRQKALEEKEQERLLKKYGRLGEAVFVREGQPLNNKKDLIQEELEALQRERDLALKQLEELRN